MGAGWSDATHGVGVFGGFKACPVKQRGPNAPLPKTTAVRGGPCGVAIL